MFKPRRVVLALLTLLVAIPLVVSAQAPDENTIVIAQSVDVGLLDPSAVASRAEANIFGHLYGTLYEISEDGSIKPYLAKSYTNSEAFIYFSLIVN